MPKGEASRDVLHESPGKAIHVVILVSFYHFVVASVAQIALV
jgi:hypothetical protein